MKQEWAVTEDRTADRVNSLPIAEENKFELLYVYNRSRDYIQSYTAAAGEHFEVANALFIFTMPPTCTSIIVHGVDRDDTFDIYWMHGRINLLHRQDAVMKLFMHALRVVVGD